MSEQNRTRGFIRRNAGLILTVAVTAVIAGGSLVVTRPEAPITDGTVYGPAVPFGDGTARVYVELEAGAPVELGVALTEAAMNGLPNHHTPGGVEIEPGHFMFAESMPLPEPNPTPYRHVLLGWNPGGHEPPGIYDVPHFDFHFYTTSDDARLAIDPAQSDYEQKGARHPGTAYIPTGYVPTPHPVMQMGLHWVDPSSPELNGEKFTRTFIYGSWDGELTFAEPMITREYLLTRPDTTIAVPVAAKHATPGYIPDSYRISWDPEKREYRIALTGFAWRD